VNRQKTFHLLCGLLSLEDSTEPGERLDGEASLDAIVWHDAIALASEQWVSAAVWWSLCRKTRPYVPTDVADYFEGVATLNRLRNAKLRAQALELARILNGVGVVPVFLKGAAHLLSDLYPDPAMRMMLDLDVLLPATQLDRCVAALRANGYAEMCDNGFPLHHHYPPLGRPGAAALIELHVEPLDTQFRGLLSHDEVFRHAVEITLEHALLAVPATWCRLVHCVAHTQFADGALIYGRLQLRDLLDTTLLSRWGNVDWGAVRKHFASRHQRTALVFHLISASRLFSGTFARQDLTDPFAQALFRRAQVQAVHPRLQKWVEALLWPWLLLRRIFSHSMLQRRLLMCLVDRSWRDRQWRMLQRVWHT
jgi:hypothetical protein